MEILRLSLAGECGEDDLVIRADDLIDFLNVTRLKYAHLKDQNTHILDQLKKVEELIRYQNG